MRAHQASAVSHDFMPHSGIWIVRKAATIAPNGDNTAFGGRFQGNGDVLRVPVFNRIGHCLLHDPKKVIGDRLLEPPFLASRANMEGDRVVRFNPHGQALHGSKQSPPCLMGR